MAGEDRTLTLATNITIAWLSNPNTRVAPDEVPAFLISAHRMIADLATPISAEVVPPAPSYEPAVSLRKSLASPERIISMIDGKGYMSLARHLKVHGLTPDEYRARYGLRPDYPMVAPAYSAARRAMALKIGLGGRVTTARSATGGEPNAKPARRRGTPAAGKAPANTPA